MNDTTQQPTAAATEPTASVEDRAAAIIAGEPADSGAEAAAATAPAPNDVAQRAEERRARIQALREQERAKVDAKARFAAQDKIQRELEAARRETEDLRRQVSSRVDVEKLTEEQFFELAERAKVPPQKLGEFLRQRIESPELVARDAAMKALDPKMGAVERELAETRREIAALRAEREQERADAEERAAEGDLVSAVTPEAVPTTYRLLQKFGQDQMLIYARNVARGLPEGVGLQAVLDEMEHRLEQVAGAFNDPNQQSQARPHTARVAAAQAKTVSNSLAQERASVVQEQDWADLPYEERVARVKRSA